MRSSQQHTFVDLLLAKLWPAAAAVTSQPTSLPASWLGLLASLQQRQLGQLVNLMQFNWRSGEAGPLSLGDGLLQQPALLEQFLRSAARRVQVWGGRNGLQQSTPERLIGYDMLAASSRLLVVGPQSCVC